MHGDWRAMWDSVGYLHATRMISAARVCQLRVGIAKHFLQLPAPCFAVIGHLGGLPDYPNREIVSRVKFPPATIPPKYLFAYRMG